MDILPVNPEGRDTWTLPASMQYPAEYWPKGSEALSGLREVPERHRQPSDGLAGLLIAGRDVTGRVRRVTLADPASRPPPLSPRLARGRAAS